MSAPSNLSTMPAGVPTATQAVAVDTFALTINDSVYQFPIVNANYDSHDYGLADGNELTGANQLNRVHIVASGGSISQVKIDRLLNEPTIFVNGSIQLFKDHAFVSPVAYVISDHRFIEHNLALMEQYYRVQANGKAQCPLYITQAVLENLHKLAPHYLQKVSPNIRLIYNFQKPISDKKVNVFSKLSKKLIAKLNKTHANNGLTNSQAIHIQANSNNPLIGVSTDIRKGFVEAGTVAFVASQLAYSMGFKEIYLHGMDLLNAHEPRFYENQQNQAPCKLDKAVENRIVPSFDYMASVYQQQGVSIYNGSPVSKDIFKQFLFSDKFLQETM